MIALPIWDKSADMARLASTEAASKLGPSSGESSSSIQAVSTRKVSCDTPRNESRCPLRQQQTIENGTMSNTEKNMQSVIL
mmetsp:Transcript_18558/g.30121  ORF Transcript_18558/g.30121 Transcript_18558/m.30121 type:complete len:81 (+) Transcript_18558:2462-2704(+)